MTAPISPELSADSLQTSNSNTVINTPEEWMKAHVNSFLQFYDSKLARQYFDFHTANKKYVPKTSAGLFILCILVPYTLAFIGNQIALNRDEFDLRERNASMYFLGIVSVLYFCTFLFLISFLILSGTFKSIKNMNMVIPWVYFCRKVAYLGITVAICSHFILRVNEGQCSEDRPGLRSWICNPHARSNGLPSDSVLLIIVVPRLVSLVMREVEAWIQGLCWLIGLGTLIFCSFAVGSCESLFLLIIFLLGLALILYDSTCHKLTLFYRYDTLRNTLAENERKADEVHATEMRHMIGNVAHDLKTPLTSFLSGIEFIIQVVNEFRNKLGLNIPLSTPEMIENLQAITDCTKNMTATNQFMLMAINRCIDYTKVTKGLQLKAKYETIDLLETLTLPLNCMADVQSTMTITLLPISKRICSHIITDKQWLQENILCLLSNAVKYSSEGEVTISVSLYTENRSQPGFLNKVKTFAPISRRKVVTETHNHNNNNLHPSISTIMQNSTVTEDIETYGNVSQMNLDHSAGVSGAAGVSSNSLNKDELSPRSPPNPNPNTNDALGSKGLSQLSQGKEDEASDKSNNTLRTARSLPTSEVFLRFEIEDTGIGIEEEAMKNLFTPFKQAQRMAGGTGLGLYSLAKRVEALKGHYGVKPRRDGRQGTLFWFEFPYRPDRFFASMNKPGSDPTRGGQISPINRNPDNSTISPLPNATIGIDVTTSPLTPTTVVNMGRETTNNTGGEISPFSDHHPHESGCPPSQANNSNQLTTGLSSFILKVPKKALNVLVVDDSASILKMTTMMLKRGGHKITTAVTGADALQKFLQTIPGNPNYSSDSQQFDVIIMDLQMPVMDGLEATRRMRRLESTGSLHSMKDLEHSLTNRTNPSLVPEEIHHQLVIGCSANSDDETIEEAYNAGVDAFMAKPFSIDTFYQMYDELIHHQMSDESYGDIPIVTVTDDSRKQETSSCRSKSTIFNRIPMSKSLSSQTSKTKNSFEK